MTLLEIFNAMVSFGEGIRDKALTTTELTKIIRSFMGSADVKVHTHRSPTVELNQVVVCGAYDPAEDEAGRSSIDLYITYNPAQKKIRISDLDWAQLCLNLIECSGHEMIHQGQYRSRNFDVSPHIFVRGTDAEPEESYLANPDEIEAYGFSIAVEAFLRFNPKKIGSQHVSQIAMYKTYRDTFGPSHQIVERLIGHVVKYYVQLSTAKTGQ